MIAANSRLMRLGLALARHHDVIRKWQWAVVAIYLLLLLGPVWMPIPNSDAHLWNNLRLFAQFIFWGVWWPGVMIATLLTGRTWCGLFCPEGTMTEWVSRRGQGRPIPRWMRWEGWHLLAFVCTTLYGQLISVYEYPDAALLILGSSSLAALAIGLRYGRGKRLWCRYLCPAAGVFGVLSRLAPVHYRVDREAWSAARRLSRIPIRAVDCPTLLDIPRLTSNAECLACGRCAGHRNAVQLAGRAPNSELADIAAPTTRAQALTLLFGMLGVATMALQWTVSPWFVRMKLAIAERLTEHKAFALLSDDIPWWLLTHHPEANDVFTWLDGGMLIVYILGGGALIGTAFLLCAAIGTRLLDDQRIDWARLSMTLAPLGAIGLIEGLSMLTLGHLKAEHVPLTWVPPIRIALLVAAAGWSLCLLTQLLKQTHSRRLRCYGAAASMMLPLTFMTWLWYTVFFVW